MLNRASDLVTLAPNGLTGVSTKQFYIAEGDPTSVSEVDHPQISIMLSCRPVIGVPPGAGYAWPIWGILVESDAGETMQFAVDAVPGGVLTLPAGRITLQASVAGGIANSINYMFGYRASYSHGKNSASPFTITPVRTVSVANGGTLSQRTIEPFCRAITVHNNNGQFAGLYARFYGDDNATIISTEPITTRRILIPGGALRYDVLNVSGSAHVITCQFEVSV
jgi:hypothetical protein